MNQNSQINWIGQVDDGLMIEAESAVIEAFQAEKNSVIQDESFHLIMDAFDFDELERAQFHAVKVRGIVEAFSFQIWLLQKQNRISIETLREVCQKFKAEFYELDGIQLFLINELSFVYDEVFQDKLRVLLGNHFPDHIKGFRIAVRNPETGVMLITTKVYGVQNANQLMNIFQSINTWYKNHRDKILPKFLPIKKEIENWLSREYGIEPDENGFISWFIEEKIGKVGVNFNMSNSTGKFSFSIDTTILGQNFTPEVMEKHMIEYCEMKTNELNEIKQQILKEKKSNKIMPSETKKNKELNIINGYREKLIMALKPFFSQEEEELLESILSGQKISRKLIFRFGGNRLLGVFRLLYTEGQILESPTEIRDWICKYFCFTDHGEIKSFKESTVWEVISKGRMYPPAREKRIMIEGLTYPRMKHS